jgi:hypothetical protein
MKPKNWLELSCRYGNQPVVLRDEHALGKQVISAREARRLYGNVVDNHAHSVLLVDVEWRGEIVTMDTAAIVVRFFSPGCYWEKFAVKMAERAVCNAHRPTVLPGVREQLLAEANELLWLAICGYFHNEKKRLEIMNFELYQQAGIRVGAGEAVNAMPTDEPEIGKFPYQHI